MKTEQKKALLNDVNRAFLALGRLSDDGPHDLRELYKNWKALYDSIQDAMCGLAVLTARLEQEIGTDNL